MNVNVKELWEKLKGFVGRINKKVLYLFLTILGVVLLVFIAVTIYNKTQYSVLFTDLANQEALAIVSYLDENGVSNYQFVNGDTIRVPSNQEARLKAKLLMEGYPKSGYGYETYRSAIGTMSTESDRNIAFLQDLQDRMAAVIRCFDGVKDAVVTIAQGDDNRYVLDQSNMTSASASVVVTMQTGGAKLTNQQAEAIKNLVARSVKGLDITQVSLSDTQGNEYSLGDLSGNIGNASYLKLQLEEQVNNSVRSEILKVLSPFFGPENVSIAVNSTVDVRHSVGESITYSQPDGAITDGAGIRGIIGQQIYDQEVIRDPDDPVGGVVGAQANADVPTYPELGATYQGDESYWQSQGTLEYDNNSEKEQTERYAAVVTDLMVAVTINSEAAAGVNTNNLLDHVARASGITADDQEGRISIVVAPFYRDTAIGGNIDNGLLPPWMLYAAIGGVALLLFLLILIGIMRKKRRKKKKKELRNMLDQQMTLVEETVKSSGADIMNIKTEKSMELRKDIRQFSEENPEIAAFMLKSWLKGGDGQNG